MIDIFVRWVPPTFGEHHLCYQQHWPIRPELNWRGANLSRHATSWDKNSGLAWCVHISSLFQMLKKVGFALASFCFANEMYEGVSTGCNRKQPLKNGKATRKSYLGGKKKHLTKNSCNILRWNCLCSYPNLRNGALPLTLSQLGSNFMMAVQLREVNSS